MLSYKSNTLITFFQLGFGVLSSSFLFSSEKEKPDVRCLNFLTTHDLYQLHPIFRLHGNMIKKYKTDIFYLSWRMIHIEQSPHFYTLYGYTEEFKCYMLCNCVSATVSNEIILGYSHKISQSVWKRWKEATSRAFQSSRWWYNPNHIKSLANEKPTNNNTGFTLQYNHVCIGACDWPLGDSIQFIIIIQNYFIYWFCYVSCTFSYMLYVCIIYVALSLITDHIGW